MDELLVKTITELVTKAVLEEKIVIVDAKTVQVKVSARHVHVSREALDILYGSGYNLTKQKELMGGQYAAEEKVILASRKLKTIENVRILGPIRSATQVEISKSDAIKLGINPPLRESGKIKGSEPMTLIGPKGSVTISEGCIIAKRHIHMNPEDAKKFGVADNDIVSVKVAGERGGIFSDVQIRVDKSYTLEMHIDTDEANGLGIACGSYLEVIK